MTSPLKKVLIIGRKGQLAQALLATKKANIEVLAVGSNEFDVSQLGTLRSIINQFKPEVIINAAAYTAVDLAESNPERAYLINADLVTFLAKICQLQRIRFIQLSTDYVFDGEQQTPYSVGDLPKPLNVYGASKRAGEVAVFTHCPDFGSVVRTSWLYSLCGNNFLLTMLRLMQERPALEIVNDQVGSPTSAITLADFLWCLIDLPNWLPIYHFSGQGQGSWFDFAVEIQHVAHSAGLLSYLIPIKPICSAQFHTAAIRPCYSVLDCSGSNGIYHMRPWQETLNVLLNSQ